MQNIYRRNWARAVAKVRVHIARCCGFIAFCIVSVAMAAAANADDSVSRTYVVVIEQMRFDPPVLTVRRGDRVVWVNKDLFPHTASANSKTFDSSSIAPNASWSYVA